MKLKLLILITVTFSLYAQKNTEILRLSKPDGFYNTLDFETGYHSGNSNYIKFTGSYRLDYVTSPFHSFFLANIEYKEGNSIEITNNGFLHLRTMYSVIPQLDLELFLQKEFDDFILLQDRNLAGGGVRYNPINYKFGKDTSGLIDFNIATGAMYEHEIYEGEFIDHKTELIRSTSYLSLKVFFDKTTNFSTVVYFQPAFEDIHNFRILNEARLSFNIYENFAIYINTTYRYDNEPEPTVLDYDFELTNGISLTF